MSEVSELRDEITALRNINTQLLDRLEQLETRVSTHIGLDFGATGVNYPHPNQSAGTIEFGEATMRLDEEGIRILDPETGEVLAEMTNDGFTGYSTGITIYDTNDNAIFTVNPSTIQIVLGPGASITDGDGSTWDGDGITLRAEGATQDFVQIENPTYDHLQKLYGFISEFNSTLQVRSEYRESGIESASATMSLGGRADSGTSKATFSIDALASQAHGASFDLYADESGVVSAEIVAVSTSLGVLNLGINGGHPTYGGGKGVVHLARANTAPTSSSTFGYFIYVDPADDHLKARGPSGTVTTLAVD